MTASNQALIVATKEARMDLAQKSDDEILRIVNPIMDNLMEASTAIDHERHVRDFTNRAKGMVRAVYFGQVCRKYQEEKGYFAKREFALIFRRPESIVVVWKQWFTKAPGEHIAELLLVQEGDRYLVDHVMVF
jgi:hypothetical protein